MGGAKGLHRCFLELACFLPQLSIEKLSRILAGKIFTVPGTAVLKRRPGETFRSILGFPGFPVAFWPFRRTSQVGKPSWKVRTFSLESNLNLFRKWPRLSRQSGWRNSERARAAFPERRLTTSPSRKESFFRAFHSLSLRLCCAPHLLREGRKRDISIERARSRRSNPDYVQFAFTLFSPIHLGTCQITCAA